GARRLFGLFAFFLAAVVIAFVLPNDLGSNVERLKYAAIPLALLAVAVAPKRMPLALALLGVRAWWYISALATTSAAATSGPSRPKAYWAPAVRYLHTPLTDSYRVEAVDTAEHWDADYLPAAGIPIVRGWYRQNDFPQNELLYDDTLGAHTYLG